MQADLQGLEISKGEIKHCSGVGLDAVFKPPTLRKFVSEIAKTSLVIFFICLSGIILGLIFPEQMVSLITIDIMASFVLLFEDCRKISFSYKNRNLIKMFEDVKRFNSVIKAIDLNDQIEAVGNPGVQLKNRGKVINALKIAREEIIRALRTERIFRENEKFIKLNYEFFEANLAALTRLQIHDQASEYGRLLNEAIQIAMDVRDEMKKLQDKRF